MSDALEDVVDIALRVADALEKVGASYFVGGSLARWVASTPWSSLRCVSRSTFRKGEPGVLRRYPW